jgi:hypothetical protein
MEIATGFNTPATPFFAPKHAESLAKNKPFCRKKRQQPFFSEKSHLTK